MPDLTYHGIPDDARATCECGHPMSRQQAAQRLALGLAALVVADEVFSDLLIAAQSAGAEDLAAKASSTLKALGGTRHIAREVSVHVPALPAEATPAERKPSAPPALEEVRTPAALPG